MSNFAVKRIDDMYATFRGAFKLARAELGASAFGMQVLDLPPEVDGYPEHDHADDGQEEVYVAMRGSGEIEIDGERHPLDPDTMVRVGPGTTRKVWPGKDGLRVLIVGGVPGAAYTPTARTEIGAPDPLAQRA